MEKVLGKKEKYNGKEFERGIDDKVLGRVRKRRKWKGKKRK